MDVTCPHCGRISDGLLEYENHARTHDTYPVRYRSASGNTYTVTGATVTVDYAALGTSVPLTFPCWRDALMYASAHGRRIAR